MKSLIIASLILLAACARGPQGASGSNGANGTDGVPGAQGPAGQTGATGPQGEQGEAGANGAQGTQGLQGEVGATGPQGTAGADSPPTPYTVVNVIQPCGAASSPYKEVLLLLENGDLLASFSETASGQNTRFAFLPDGSYVDTDASGCAFTVSTVGSTRSVSWTGGGLSWNTGGQND